MTFIPASDLFDALFHVSTSALRLETRDNYGVPYENEPLTRYLAGQPVDTSHMDGWTTYLAGLRGRGAVMRRVRVLTVPLSDYQRFGLAQAAINDAAGEDLRYLDRSSPAAAALPGYDYWVFDERTVAVLEFDDRDDLVGAYAVRDRSFVAQRLGWLHSAWPAAVPYREFRQAHPVRDL